MTEQHKGTASTTADTAPGATAVALDLGIQMGLIGDDVVCRYADMITTLSGVAKGIRGARESGATVPNVEDVLDGLVGSLLELGDQAFVRLTAERAAQSDT